MLGRTTLVAMAFGTAAAAQELPSANRVEALVSDQLPSYWTINDLSIVATSRKGDAAAPKAVMRFEAAATAQGALFAATGNEGPFVLVSETYGAEEERTLYGFAELSYSAGEWDGGVTIENPVAELGQPSDYFQRPTLVVGTEEADQRLEALHSLKIGIAAGANATELQRIERQHQEAVSDLKARQTEALAELQTQHANELADAKSAAQQELASVRREYEEKIASLEESKEPMVAQAKAERAQALEEQRSKTQQAIQELREQQRAEIEELKAEAASRKQELTALERQHQKQIADLKQSKEPMVADLRAKREEALQDVRAQTEQALQDLREQQRSKMEELKAQHAEERGEIIAQQEQELAKLEKRLATEAESLREQIESSQEIVALQQKLEDSLSKRNAREEKLLEALAKARTVRKAALSDFPKNWAGQIRCVAESDDETFDNTRRVFISIKDVKSHVMNGHIAATPSNAKQGDSWSAPMTLLIKDESITFPLDMRLTAKAGFWRDDDVQTPRYVLDVAVASDGLMTGTMQQTWKDGGQTYPAECQLQLSS